MDEKEKAYGKMAILANAVKEIQEGKEIAITIQNVLSIFKNTTEHPTMVCTSLRLRQTVFI